MRLKGKDLLPFAVLGITLAVPIRAQTYECSRIRSEIVIDGFLAESDWRRAKWVVLRKNDSGGPTQSTGKFALLWDSQNLYLGYDFEDLNILSTITTRDARLWIQDVAEIFITPFESERVYYEFQFSPLKNWRDVVVLHRGLEHRINPLSEWNASVRLQVRVKGTLQNNQDRDQGWALEAAIPFEDLWLAPNIPPKPGDTWHMNVFRIDYGLEMAELSAWIPTLGPSFHTPSRFGVLVFREAVQE